MRILLVNWNDRANPHAGGAEIHLHEIFGRLAARGHRIDLVASGWPGAAPRAEIDGMTVQRVGGRHSFALLGRGAVRAALRHGQYDVVVEDINKLPLFLPALTPLPFYAIVPHLFGTTAFAEASWPLAAIVWAAERPIPRAYRRAAFQAISNSTRDDLVARGVDADRIEVIYPGVDATVYRPDAATPRAAQPLFLYVGRLKRYKGVEIARGRARSPARRDVGYRGAGGRPAAARGAGVPTRPRRGRTVFGLRLRGGKTPAATLRLERGIPQSQGGVGDFERRSGRVRHPGPGVGQSGPAGIGP